MSMLSTRLRSIPRWLGPFWIFSICILLLVGCDETVESGEDRILSIRVDERQRLLTLYIPARYDGSDPAPLLIALHGTPGNGPGMQISTGLDEIADSKGWLIAYPDGVGGSWSAGCLCSDAELAGIDDLEFIERLINRVQSDYEVDTDRIYAVGFSAGGIMNYRIACDLHDRFAAVASVGSSMTFAQAESCTPNALQSILTMVGTQDEAIPWSGSGTTAGHTMAVDSTLAFWARANGCDGDPAVDYPGPKDGGLDVRRERYLGCSGGSEVTLYAIEGGMHTWPKTANATLEAFFERHIGVE